ncbi:lipocalin-like domain-containing protein [Rhodococcus sp. P1Y]|uniref:lipocalin-like domain-containing protein n=1 Tax=Rhodococcus sp. P1Y TaxID=1302308 RepID=UPI000EB45008|nr:lipocalin-like domain-containing protein [Rhodococcus sp. P1Y]AYJ48907.1 hypothetical protein D8W71_11775 [Rhodococcus sp. P1Y]
MALSQKDLIGAWTFESAVEVFDDGERRPEFGPHAAGYLSYSPNGIVLAVLGNMERPRSGATDPQRASDAQLVHMAQGFIAYAGPFTVDSDSGTVTHHIEVALFTDWQGAPQERSVRIEGDRLSIIGSPRTAPDERRFHVELEWQRCSRKQ